MQYVTYLGIAPLVVAALIASFWAYSYLVLTLARHVILGAAVLLIVFVAEATLVDLPGIHLYFYVYPQDIAMSLLAIAGLFRLFWLRQLGGRRMLLGIVCFLLFLSMARGLVVFDAKLVLNEARSDWWFMAGVPYFASFSYNKELSERMLAYWMKAALALCALVLFRWSAMMLHLGITSQWSKLLSDSFPMRVITCDATYFVLIGNLVSLHFILAGKATRWQRWLLYAGGPIAILLQHRTIWVCVAISLLLFLAYTPRLPKQIVMSAIALSFGLVVLGAVFVVGRGKDVQVSFGEAAQDSGDWDWRVDGWTSLLKTHFNEPVSTLIGEPYGAGLGRYINGQYIDVIAHNEYIQLACRIGVVGLLCFVGLYVGCLWTIHFVRNDHDMLLFPDQNFWRIWILMSLVYFVAYSPIYDQSILLGMLISISTSVSSQAADDRLTAFRRTLPA